MPRATVQFVCQSCGASYRRWLGRCPDCGEWDSFAEESVVESRPSAVAGPHGEEAEKPRPLSQVSTEDSPRLPVGIGEMDRVLGGGLAPGGVVLLGGEPGIGKSTLLLQAAGRLAAAEQTVLYLSGEESAPQIAMRAQRLGIDESRLLLQTSTDLQPALSAVADVNPCCLVVDSIQTVSLREMSAPPGSLAQVRAAMSLLVATAKRRDMPVVAVGHVTKDGSLAGPKALEHMVDTVLQFEGDGQHAFRVLRALKNRFGSTQETGIFTMGESGLREVVNPSGVLLAERLSGGPGSAVTPVLEGTRPLLVEVQALVTPTHYASPRRVTTGPELGRANMALAVLEKRVGCNLSGSDVFVNIAGGIRVGEPGLDLGIVVAAASSYRELPARPETVVCGEVGLSGEVRSVGRAVQRAHEAARLGFQRCVLPWRNVEDAAAVNDIDLVPVRTVREALEQVLLSE